MPFFSLSEYSIACPLLLIWASCMLRESINLYHHLMPSLHFLTLLLYPQSMAFNLHVMLSLDNIANIQQEETNTSTTTPQNTTSPTWPAPSTPATPTPWKKAATHPALAPAALLVQEEEEETAPPPTYPAP